MGVGGNLSTSPAPPEPPVSLLALSEWTTTRLSYCPILFDHPPLIWTITQTRHRRHISSVWVEEPKENEIDSAVSAAFEPETR